MSLLFTKITITTTTTTTTNLTTTFLKPTKIINKIQNNKEPF
jgi:hypothetical protein